MVEKVKDITGLPNGDIHIRIVKQKCIIIKAENIIKYEMDGSWKYLKSLKTKNKTYKI